MTSRIRKCRAHFQEVRAQMHALAADWKSGHWTIRQLATREHLGQDNIRCILHEAIPDDAEYERIRAQHEQATRKKNCIPFRDGNKPWITGRHIRTRTDHNLPIGTIRKWSRKGHGREDRCLGTVTRRFIKVSNISGYRIKNWVPYARFLWERENGPIPAGHFVIHADGKPLNDKIGNLILVTRAETALRATATVDVKARGRKSWEKRWLPKRIADARARKQQEVRDQCEATEFDDNDDEEMAA